LEALRIVGKALMRPGKPKFALEVFEQALALELSRQNLQAAL
jgi:hypothetical protein